MSGIHIAGPVAYLEASASAVYFSKANASAGTYQQVESTAAPIKKMQTALDVAYWGEDNRFPSNIEQQMAYCGVGKAALDWKARALWGNGIIAGNVIDYEDGGKKEIFQPIKPDSKEGKVVYNFLNNRRLFRFFLEYLQDWTWYGNTFPEVLLSKDAKSIAGLVHQESCDCRFKQMDDDAKVSTVYLSKLWGAARDQYAKFDPKRGMAGLMENPVRITELDNKYVKALDCIDMYDPVESLKGIASKLLKSKGLEGFKSAILPSNYPSVNKTYYQVPAWDGARLGGWVEIAAKIPSLIKTLYNKAFQIKYHIEIPETYFGRHYGEEKWEAMSEDEQKRARVKVLKDMDEFLSGSENAFKSFVSFFDVDKHTGKELGQVKINAIEDKTNLDKELITSSAADIQILISMQAHPTLFGAGTIAAGTHRSGGSDVRELWLTYMASLSLERQVMLEPLYLVRDYNREVGGMPEWSEGLEFRIKDTILTTLDTGAGTTKVVS